MRTQIKRLWKIPVVQDLFWFFVILVSARLSWLVIYKIEYFNQHLRITEIQNWVSELYVKFIHLFLPLFHFNYVIVEKQQILFYDKNMDFNIYAACSALGHYFYFTFLFFFLPNITRKMKITFLLAGLPLIFLSRSTVLFFQVLLFRLKSPYFHLLHNNSILFSFATVFALWIVAMNMKARVSKEVSKN